MPSRQHLRPSLLALVATGVFASVAAGCGDSGDNGSPAATGQGDEARAKAAVDGLYAAMGNGDAEGVCASLSKPAQDQVAGGGIGAGEGKTCTAAFQQFLDAAERQGGLSLTLKAKVRRVTVTGDRAVAKVSFGGKRTGDIPLVRQGGEWKLDRAGAAPSQ